MAGVTITFQTSTNNIQVKFLINGEDQGVDANNSPLNLPDIAPGAYAFSQTITTKDGSKAGGGSCATTITETGQADPIGTVPGVLNTISLGQTSDTALGAFTVV